MNVIQGFECLNACLTNCFNYYGIDLKPSDIFFIGDGLQITYQSEPTPNIGAYLYESNFKFLEKYNIPYIHDFAKKNNALEIIEKYTNENKLICIKISSTFLTYNRVFKQTENSSHFIIVEKIKDDKFKIIDGFVPTLIPSTFEGEVDAEEILNAWEGKNYEYIVIKEYKKEKNYKLEAINKFYFMKNQYILKDEKTGVYSFFTMIKDLENYIFKDDFKQLVLDLNYIIKIYGFLTSKYYILEKIEDKNKYDNYKLIIDKYNMISFSLVKFGITKNTTLYNQIKTNVQTLIEQEISVLKEV